jgi:hypothetical protein
MTTTIKFNFNEYVRISSQNVGYNPEAKEQFLKMSKKLAAITAQELGLEKGSYDIRVNKAGVAVSGEVTLHSDNLYVQFGQSSMPGNGRFLCRSCKGRKDYTGGSNQWYKFEDLRDFGKFINFLKWL